MSESNYVRVPVKLTKSMKKWLDEESKNTGIPQSTLLLLGLELLKEERENKNRNRISNSSELETKLAELVNQLENLISDNKKEGE